MTTRVTHRAIFGAGNTLMAGAILAFALVELQADLRSPVPDWIDRTEFLKKIAYSVMSTLLSGTMLIAAILALIGRSGWHPVVVIIVFQFGLDLTGNYLFVGHFTGWQHYFDPSTAAAWAWMAYCTYVAFSVSDPERQGNLAESTGGAAIARSWLRDSVVAASLLAAIVMVGITWVSRDDASVALLFLSHEPLFALATRQADTLAASVGGCLNFCV